MSHEIAKQTTQPLELWGGHECTLNRTSAGFADQSQLTGHDARADDVERFASLGITRLRYPILWEKVAPNDPSECDWGLSDRAMKELRHVGLAPIIGLVHHGSGPAYTSLGSPHFAPGLAGHAQKVAERYPDVTDWTPVNEPLTTARFSLLYGHWYPHTRDELSFWCGLLNQIDATRMAMRAIRRVNADARLIQTEDLGQTYSTPTMSDQADHDNLRRWATWDLLCGKLTTGHPLWARLSGLGLADRLHAIADDPCPPDIVGVNHYLTSDRFLDHRLERYPPATHGRNWARRYADVEAARVVIPSPGGLASVLQETWERYQKPIAVTEVHNACTREEQMRWIYAAWLTAEALRRQGAGIRAVTAWSLFGSYDWNTLLTKQDGHYECGVFDVRGAVPRPTAAAGLLRQLAEGATPSHPTLSSPGWWHRNDRLTYPPFRIASTSTINLPLDSNEAPILITGATGTLGRALAAACRARCLRYVLTDRTRLDLEAPESIGCALDRAAPWAVINAAGWVRVDDAERDADACMRANRDGSVALAVACAARGIHYTTFSSDLVFDGTSTERYQEGDATNPLGVYGRSKAEADRILLSHRAPILVARTAAFFSPDDDHNFAVQVLAHAANRKRFAAANDLWVSPTYLPDLVRAVIDLVIDGETGLWHLVNDGSTTWADFAVLVARSVGTDPSHVAPVSSEELGYAARRPRHGHLASARGAIMPALDDAIRRFAAEAHARQ